MFSYGLNLFMGSFNNQFQFDFTTKCCGKTFLGFDTDQFDCFTMIFQKDTLGKQAMKYRDQVSVLQLTTSRLNCFARG